MYKQLILTVCWYDTDLLCVFTKEQTYIMLFSKNINVIINFDQSTQFHVSFGVLSII